MGFCPTCGALLYDTTHVYETHAKPEDCIKSLVRRVQALEARPVHSHFIPFQPQPYPTGVQPLTVGQTWDMGGAGGGGGGTGGITGTGRITVK